MPVTLGAAARWAQMQCEASPQTLSLMLALWWRARLHPEGMWKSQKGMRKAPGCRWGPGACRFPVLICSELLWFLWSHTVLLLCPSALSYTFTREKPQVVMEVQLQSTFHLLAEGLYTPKNWKGTLRVCLSLPCFSVPITWCFVGWSLAVQIL